MNTQHFSLSAGTLATVFCLLCPLPLVRAAEWQSTLLRDHPLAGALFSTGDRQPISRESALRQMQDADYLLIGEKHDNPDHHRLESLIIEKRLRVKPQTAAVFEMLDQSQQPLIDQLRPSDSAVVIKEKLRWQNAGWSWKDYGPLFEQVVSAGAPLVAGNISREKIMSIYSGQAAFLSEDLRFKTLSRMDAIASELILEQVYESHCRAQARDSLGPMVTIQLARDASMADALKRRKTGDGALLVAGGFHVDRRMGVPQHLYRLDPGGNSLVVLLVEVEAEKRKIEDHAELLEAADILWFTPKFTDKDYCEGIEEKLGKAHKKVSE